MSLHYQIMLLSRNFWVIMDNRMHQNSAKIDSTIRYQHDPFFSFLWLVIWRSKKWWNHWHIPSLPSNAAEQELLGYNGLSECIRIRQKRESTIRYQHDPFYRFCELLSGDSQQHLSKTYLEQNIYKGQCCTYYARWWIIFPISQYLGKNQVMHSLCSEILAHSGVMRNYFLTRYRESS